MMVGIKETLPVESRTESGLKHTVSNFGNLFKDKTFMGYTLTSGLIFGGFLDICLRLHLFFKIYMDYRYKSTAFPLL